MFNFIKEYIDIKSLKLSANLHLSVALSFILFQISSFLDYRNNNIRLKKKRDFEAVKIVTLQSKNILNINNNNDIHTEKPKLENKTEDKVISNDKVVNSENISMKEMLPKKNLSLIDKKIKKEIITKPIIDKTKTDVLKSKKIFKKEKLIDEKQNIKIKNTTVVENVKSVETKVEIADLNNKETIDIPNDINNTEDNNEDLDIDTIVTQDPMYVNAKDIVIENEEVTYQALIKNQIEQCWSKFANTKTDIKLIIVIVASYDINGDLIKIEEFNENIIKTPDYFRMAFQAKNAIKDCSPLKNLPKEKYVEWKDVELRFQYNKPLENVQNK